MTSFPCSVRPEKFHPYIRKYMHLCANMRQCTSMRIRKKGCMANPNLYWHTGTGAVLAPFWWYWHWYWQCMHLYWQYSVLSTAIGTGVNGTISDITTLVLNSTYTWTDHTGTSTDSTGTRTDGLGIGTDITGTRTDGTGTGTGGTESAGTDSTGTDNNTGPCASKYMICGIRHPASVFYGVLQWKSTAGKVLQCWQYCRYLRYWRYLVISDIILCPTVYDMWVWTASQSDL